MKITLEFDVSDEFEKKDAEAALKASSLVIALDQIDNNLRNMLKYEKCDDEKIAKLLSKEEVHDVVYYIRSMINQELQERGLRDLLY